MEKNIEKTIIIPITPFFGPYRGGFCSFTARIFAFRVSLCDEVRPPVSDLTAYRLADRLAAVRP